MGQRSQIPGQQPGVRSYIPKGLLGWPKANLTKLLGLKNSTQTPLSSMGRRHSNWSPRPLNFSPRPLNWGQRPQIPGQQPGIRSYILKGLLGWPKANLTKLLGSKKFYRHSFIIYGPQAPIFGLKALKFFLH